MVAAEEAVPAAVLGAPMLLDELVSMRVPFVNSPPSKLIKQLIKFTNKKRWNYLC